MTKEERIASEKERLAAMYAFQEEVSGNASFVFGIDEAGRGPLCGPVVAGCCLLDPDMEILWLNDSKKLSEKKREELFTEITEKCFAYGIGIVGPERIDEINILNATYEAMNDAFLMCRKKLETAGTPYSLMKEMSIVLVDGNKTVPQLGEKQICVIGGDAKCPSISAASILAKVSRDRMMAEYDILYPGYGFAGHKGYGTKEHYEAIRNLGILPIHRRSFLKNMIHE